jgi:hypothetical protein
LTYDFSKNQLKLWQKFSGKKKATFGMPQNLWQLHLKNIFATSKSTGKALKFLS